MSDHLDCLRQRIRHENDLINHRMLWLLQFEGFLFAGFSAIEKDLPKTIVYPLGGLGICAAISAFVAMRCALNSIKKIASEDTEAKAAQSPIDYELKKFREIFTYQVSEANKDSDASKTAEGTVKQNRVCLFFGKMFLLFAKFLLPWHLLPFALIIAWVIIFCITPTP